MAKETVGVSLYGQMELDMKGIGKKTEQKVKVLFIILMVMFTKVSGKTIRPKDMEYIGIFLYLD